jgi:hypothetical protein
MKIKVCRASVYLHSMGPDSIHMDIEHPMLDRILAEKEQATCQGKGHGMFVRLGGEMLERARRVMRMFSSLEGAEPTLTNEMVAKELDEIADLLAVTGDSQRSTAFRRGARSVESADSDVSSLASSGQLRSLPWIGQTISGVIEEYLECGQTSYLRELQGRVPAITGLLSLDGIDTRTATLLHQRLGIRTLVELEDAFENGRIVLQPQPVTLEEMVALEIFRRRAGEFSKLMELLFEDLSFIEVLDRRFTTESLVYGMPKIGSTRTLFTLYPSREGIRVEFHPGVVPDRVDKEALLESLRSLTPMNEDSEPGVLAFLLKDRERGWRFCQIMRDGLQEVLS